MPSRTFDNFSAKSSAFSLKLDTLLSRLSIDLARLFDMYDMTLIEVLHENYIKLTDRMERGVIKGDGDNR